MPAAPPAQRAAVPAPAPPKARARRAPRNDETTPEVTTTPDVTATTEIKRPASRASAAQMPAVDVGEPGPIPLGPDSRDEPAPVGKASPPVEAPATRRRASRANAAVTPAAATTPDVSAARPAQRAAAPAAAHRRPEPALLPLPVLAAMRQPLAAARQLSRPPRSRRSHAEPRARAPRASRMPSRGRCRRSHRWCRRPTLDRRTSPDRHDRAGARSRFTPILRAGRQGDCSRRDASDHAPRLPHACRASAGRRWRRDRAGRRRCPGDRAQAARISAAATRAAAKTLERPPPSPLNVPLHQQPRRRQPEPAPSHLQASPATRLRQPRLRQLPTPFPWATTQTPAQCRQARSTVRVRFNEPPSLRHVRRIRLSLRRTHVVRASPSGTFSQGQPRPTASPSRRCVPLHRDHGPARARGTPHRSHATGHLTHQRAGRAASRPGAGTCTGTSTSDRRGGRQSSHPPLPEPPWRRLSYSASRRQTPARTGSLYATCRLPRRGARRPALRPHPHPVPHRSC